MSCFFIYVNSRIKGKMLPSSLECDDTLWWRVDDLLVIFSSCLKLSLLELFMNIVSPILYSFLIFYHAILLSFLLWVSTLCLDLLLFLLYKGLVDNTYLKEYTNDSKQGWCCHRAKGHPLCYNRVSFNILISIESLSHVLNNVPLLFTTTSNF